MDWAWWDRSPIKNARVTSFLVRYANENAASAGSSRLERFLHDGFDVTFLHNESDEEKKTEAYHIQRKLKREHVLASTNDAEGGLTIRVLNRRSLASVTSFLKTEKPIFAGQLPHTQVQFSLNQGRRVSIITGDVEHNEKNRSLLPQTLGELTIRHKVIAKAALVYVNCELGDYAPTIERYEVRREDRGKGFGQRFLTLVEEYIRSHGFDRIWATDAAAAGSSNFWEHMGYQDFDGIGEELLKSLID